MLFFNISPNSILQSQWFALLSVTSITNDIVKWLDDDYRKQFQRYDLRFHSIKIPVRIAFSSIENGSRILFGNRKGIELTRSVASLQYHFPMSQAMPSSTCPRLAIRNCHIQVRFTFIQQSSDACSLYAIQMAVTSHFYPFRKIH